MLSEEIIAIRIVILKVRKVALVLKFLLKESLCGATGATNTRQYDSNYNNYESWKHRRERNNRNEAFYNCILRFSRK